MTRSQPPKPSPKANPKPGPKPGPEPSSQPSPDPGPDRPAQKITADAIALIGFGEAGAAFAEGWTGPDAAPLAHDILLRDPARAAAMRARMAAAGVSAHAEPAPALDRARLIFSLVTADRALEAARSAAAHLPAGAFYCDGNSCAPQTKARAAALIEAAGGRYIDMAIMAPVHPRGHATPVLIAGPHAEAALPVLRGLGMQAETTPGPVGAASAVKLVRSVMVKGLEALMAECVLTGRELGVEERVLASLEASYPGFGFRDRAAYAFDRMMVHGTRRAAEMEEAARMVAEAGLSGRMARATAAWQRAIGALDLPPGPEDAAERADRIRAALKPGATGPGVG